jgi:predicted RNA-binding Zn-ribbon protein involved in translation (DUF1610 family)
VTLAERRDFWRALAPAIIARATLVDFECDLVGESARTRSRRCRGRR